MPRYNLRRLLAHLPLALLVIVAGLLHRQAVSNPWADDRILVEEPPWFQIAAPLLHAAVPESPSLTSVLTHPIDQLSDASTIGDIRALAACLTALSAGATFVLLRRLGVPNIAAVLLSFATTGFILPVSTATSAAHGMQMFLGACLLVFLLPAPDTARWRRMALLALVTVLGAMNHATFLAGAAMVWIAEWRRSAAPGRTVVTITALAALVVGLVMTAWLINQSAAIYDEGTHDQPSTFEVVSGLVTGRFTPALQPSSEQTRAVAMQALPRPLVVVIPLAGLAWMRRDTRRFVVMATSAGVAAGLFAFYSWLPDPTVAYAPTWIVMIVFAGLGLSWLAARRGVGAKILAVVSAAAIGLNGFYDSARATLGVDAGRLQAFALSAPAAIGDGIWVAERLAIDRALLLQPTLAPGSSRVSAEVQGLQAVPEDRPVIVLTEAAARLRREGGLSASITLPYPSVTSFIASYRDDMWLAIAVRDQATQNEGFWKELLARVGAADVLAATHRVAGLVRTGSVTAVSRVQGHHLALEYGEPMGSANERLPASFAVETDPVARVTINGSAVAESPEGAVVVMFDPWSTQTESWVVGANGQIQAPEIRERRLRAAHFLGLHTPLPDVQLPAVTSAPVRTNVEMQHHDWFGSGWHGPEGSREQLFRWTAAEAADVNVAVSRSHAIRLRLGAGLATAPNLTNGLGISWNGTIIQPIRPWDGSREAEWIIPARLVRRGLNVLTIHVTYLVSPAMAGIGADSRWLGAAIHFISFEPAVVPSDPG